MKKTFALLLLLTLVVGCSNNTGKDKENKQEVVTKEEDNTPPDKKESILEEKQVNYPEVKTIVQYLKLSPEKVKTITETKTRLVFCFYEENVDVHDETILSTYNYVRLLEKNGYKMVLRDATISSTFELEKGEDKISITTIANLDEWKDAHKNELDVQNITNENVVCEVTKK